VENCGQPWRETAAAWKNKGPGVKKKTEKITKALIWAASEGRTDIVINFVEKGVDVNVKDDLKFTPLAMAIRGGHMAVIKVLLENGVDVSMEIGPHGYTPLKLATDTGDLDMVKLLLQNET